MRALFDRLSLEPDAFLLGQLGEADDTAGFRNSILESLVGEQTWDLDKSFRTFEMLPRFVPALTPIGLITDFRGIDVDVPNDCDAPDSGFYGCISATRLSPVVETLRRNPHADIVAALRAYRPSLRKRLFGNSATHLEIITRFDDAYHRLHWTNFCSAVLETYAHGDFLGLGMSV